MNCCWVVSQPQSSGLDIHRGCSDDVKRPRLDWGLRAIRPGCIGWICSLECGWPIPLPAIDTGRIERSHWLCRRLLEYAICLKYRREHSRVVHISYDENSRAEKRKTCCGNQTLDSDMSIGSGVYRDAAGLDFGLAGQQAWDLAGVFFWFFCLQDEREYIRCLHFP